MTSKSTGISRFELERSRKWFEHEFGAREEPLIPYADALVEAFLSTNRTGAPLLTAAAVKNLNPMVEAIIGDCQAAIGAGFIAAPGVVDLRDRYILWLYRRNGAIRRLRLNFDRTDVNAYDYVEMDWYIQARDLNHTCLTGPYLDYAGSDALVLTITAPVISENTFLGVVAIDLMAQDFEDLITSHLCELPGEVVVTNNERTIVATNSTRWMPGERLSKMPEQDPDEYESIMSIGRWAEWQLGVARTL